MAAKTKKKDMRTICLEIDPKRYVRPEPTYEFSNGKKFYQPQKNNITK